MQIGARKERLTELRCPSCGNRALPEFFQPAGLAVCPQCGILVRRGDKKSIPVGFTSRSVTKLIRSRMRDGETGQQIEDRVHEVVASRLAVDKDVVHPDAHLIRDLNADSLDMIELMVALEEEFGLPIDGE